MIKTGGLCLTHKMDIPFYTSSMTVHFSIHAAAYTTTLRIHNILRVIPKVISFSLIPGTFTSHVTLFVWRVRMDNHCLNLVSRVLAKVNSKRPLAWQPGGNLAALRVHIV